MRVERVALVTTVLVLLLARSHGEDTGTGNVADQWHDPNYVHDVDHIQEHYEGKVEFNTSAMSPEELEFHYFQQHDTDDNFMLDGLEILAAITEPNRHHHHGDKKEDEVPLTIEQQEKQKQEVEENLKMMTDIVDKIFTDDDADNDGYLSYAEYLAARRKAS
ncbi:multiple coagulation factor deficiency protein 2 homolog [Lingula anatina]|uniref:Multiple coagulation factor deficiency protein 2 homolog n=1 Tax=Lingula anatina TaxID=7574 RepID=A0A1S3H1D0_LINAN|nr:multiple coagulation factor deficiency protein 2 homolog [Lingula anatina]|eukprot:XP_013379286.1 multiple coagulation factor deficiency protein 2 homolog [Lingula anatina]